MGLLLVTGPIIRYEFARTGGPSRDHVRTAHGEALARWRRTRVQVPAAPPRAPARFSS